MLADSPDVSLKDVSFAAVVPTSAYGPPEVVLLEITKLLSLVELSVHVKSICEELMAVAVNPLELMPDHF